ncbi:MAG: universal stress protein [Rhodobacteraceae bacterium]|nr:universal stress protein [Paracoccaceae bacterium]
MYQKIMVPVDLRHTAKMGKALRTAGDLARLYGAAVCYVGVTGPEPSNIGHNPDEFAARLDRFAKEEATKGGHSGTSHMVISQDPTVELDRALQGAVDTVGADLVVMATHEPNVSDFIWASHGGTLALHSHATVMLVRG